MPPGTVDRKDDRLDRRIVAEVLQQLLHLAVVGDDARDFDARDLGAVKGRAVGREQRDEGDGDGGDSAEAPEKQAALEVPPVGKGIGVEGQGASPGGLIQRPELRTFYGMRIKKERVPGWPERALEIG